MTTSLWEIQALQRHYFPATATLAKGIELSNEGDAAASGSSKAVAAVAISSASTSHDLDEFARYSYATLFGQEAKRRLKETPLAHEKATSHQHVLFQPGDCFDGIFDLPNN